MHTLNDYWNKLLAHFPNNANTSQALWEEIVQAYSGKKRHYHNLTHIADMIYQADQFKDFIEDFHLLSFAIWYHDIVYDASRTDNELKSAELAIERLEQLGFSSTKCKHCYDLIMMTKTHRPEEDNNDAKFLLDFDLSILGREWESYLQYKNNVRKEYAIYPDEIYNLGRKKALLQFLERDTIYQTNFYRNAFEEQARKNMKQEIASL